MRCDSETFIGIIKTKSSLHAGVVRRIMEAISSPRKHMEREAT